MNTEVTLETYSDIRDLTRKIGADCQARISGYLDTVKHHFRFGTTFGACLSGSKSGLPETPRNAVAAVAQFAAAFKQIAESTPLNIDPKLPEGVDGDPGPPILCPFTYQHDLSLPTGTKRLTVAKPLRFVLAFPGYPFSELWTVASRGPKEKLRDFVFRYAALNYVVMQNKGLLRLFDDLRFPIRSESFETFGALPITTVSAPAGSLLPPSSVVAQICKFSGTDTAEELVDFEAWNMLPDPFTVFFAGLANQFCSDDTKLVAERTLGR